MSKSFFKFSAEKKQYDNKYEFFQRSDLKKYEDVIIDAYNE